jgi:acetyl-CoA synthetase (ADP-forming)
MDEPEAMIMVAGVMAQSPRLGPGGLGLVVSSGGGGAVTADRLSEAGLPLTAWTQATQERLDKHFLRSHQNNPIDLGAHIGALGPHIFKETIDAVAEDPGVAAFMYIMTPQPLMPQTVDAVIEVWRRVKKPVIFVLDTSRFGDDVRERLIAAGLPFVTRIDDAIRVFDALVRDRDNATLPQPAPPQRPAGAGPLPNVKPGFLTEPVAKALVASYGVTTTREHVVRSAEEAVVAAEKLGYPVVAKGVSEKVVHKSDLGLVRLGLADAPAVREAFAGITAALARAGDPDGSSVVIAEMVRGEAEVIIGARYDANFGAQVMVGFGGVMVEILRDVQLATAPVSREQALAMLRRLKLWPLLDGARGRPRLDVEAIVDAVTRVSWLAHDLGERLCDFEINPLIVRAAGKGAVAVDARGNIGP